MNVRHVFKNLVLLKGSSQPPGTPNGIVHYIEVRALGWPLLGCDEIWSVNSEPGDSSWQCVALHHLLTSRVLPALIGQYLQTSAGTLLSVNNLIYSFLWLYINYFYNI